jgi:hypothetical protein
VRIFQEGSAKNATEGNKSEEKEVTIQLWSQIWMWAKWPNNFKSK